MGLLAVEYPNRPEDVVIRTGRGSFLTSDCTHIETVARAEAVRSINSLTSQALTEIEHRHLRRLPRLDLNIGARNQITLTAESDLNGSSVRVRYKKTYNPEQEQVGFSIARTIELEPMTPCKVAFAARFDQKCRSILTSLTLSMVADTDELCEITLSMWKNRPDTLWFSSQGDLGFIKKEMPFLRLTENTSQFDFDNIILMQQLRLIALLPEHARRKYRV